MLAELLSRRVLIILGKGGVGKSTLSAAIATLAARDGTHALIMECDARAPLAATFGVEPSFAPVQVADNIWLMTLDGRAALEEYLRLVVPGRMLLKAVFASRLYQFFVQAAPGLRELMMLGKVYYEAGRDSTKPPAHPIIIVDAPASGQALSLLKMPGAARATFGESIVGKESRNISQMIRDRRRCAIVQVTTADGLSISETIETHAQLSGINLAPAAVFFNRVPSAEFGADDISALSNRHGPRLRKKDLDHLAALARSELKRAADGRKALARIRNETGSPVLEISDHSGLSGLKLIDRVAADLASQREAESAPRAMPRRHRLES
jgi:anion-transporting ATPase